MVEEAFAPPPQHIRDPRPDARPDFHRLPGRGKLLRALTPGLAFASSPRRRISESVAACTAPQLRRFPAVAPPRAAQPFAGARSAARFVSRTRAGDRHAARRGRLSRGHLGRPLDRPVAARRPQRAHRSDLERARLAAALAALGTPASPSVTNFLLVGLGDRGRAAAATDRLLGRGLVPRTFGGAHPLADHLRFTVRSPAEDDRLLAALAEILPALPYPARSVTRETAS